jgi:hypothetical protein
MWSNRDKDIVTAIDKAIREICQMPLATAERLS